jgi:hypothetical protein
MEGGTERCRRRLIDMNCSIEGDDWGFGVEEWDFVLDGLHLLVPSPSGAHLRCHSYFIAVPQPRDAHHEREFAACLIGRGYTVEGSEGFITVFSRGEKLGSAVNVVNRSYLDWRESEHAALHQPDHQDLLTVEDFERAWEGPTLAQEPWAEVDAFAAEAYGLLTRPVSDAPISLQVTA